MLLIVLLPTIVNASEQDATKAVAKALVKQLNIDVYLKHFKNEYIPKPIQKHLGVVLGTYEGVDKGYLEFKWTF